MHSALSVLATGALPSDVTLLLDQESTAILLQQFMVLTSDRHQSVLILFYIFVHEKVICVFT